MLSWKRLRGPLLAVLLAAATLFTHAWIRGDSPLGFSFTSLPGFDAYVYVAASDQPSVFTVAPWGYRILTPWVVHVLPGLKTFKAFRYVTQASLLGLAALMFVFLRRLGYAEWAAWLGVVLLCASPPAGELMGNPFLAEPLAALLFLLVLIAIDAAVPLATLALLLALLVLAKDAVFLLFLLPLVVLARSAQRTRRRAILEAAGLGVGGLLLALSLRLYWTPHLTTPRPESGLWATAVEELRRFGGTALMDSLLYGLLPLAILGLTRTSSRPYLRRYGYLIPILLALPFVAWLNKPAADPSGLYDGPRLWIYAVLLLIPLALGLVNRPQASAPVVWRPRWLARASVAGLVLVIAFPFVASDRYRRAPLHERRDGVQALAACRYSLGTASRLARGEDVRLEPRPTAPPDDPAHRRWYLLDGWTSLAYLGDGEMASVARQASFIVPLLSPREIEVEVSLRISRPAVVFPVVNGHPLRGFTPAHESATQRFRLPPQDLFRGDNIVTFTIKRPCTAIWVDSLVLRPVGR